MSTKLTITSDAEAIRFSGGLDLYSVESARAELLAGVAARPTLAVDVSGVSECDTAGWQLLLALRQTAVAAGKPFAIRASSPAVEECRRGLGLVLESRQPTTL